MRNRPEILGDGLEALKEETDQSQSDLKLALLTLEVLVDIRDVLHKDIAQIIEDLNFIANKD